MAWYRAVSAGVASDLARWEVSTDNGVSWSAALTLPTVADTVYANGYTIDIDTDFDASKYSTETATGVTAGGGFTARGGLVITGDSAAGTTTCMTFDPAATLPTTIIGNGYGSAVNDSDGIFTDAAPLLTVVGSVYNGSRNITSIASGAHGIYAGVSGSFRVTGDALLAFGSASFSCGAAAVTPRSGLIEGRAIGSLVTANRYASANCLVNEIEGANLNAVVYGKFVMPSNNQPNWTNCKAKAGANVQIEIYDELNQPVLCNPLYAQDQADPADVRSGTSYANGALTGTAAIPPAESVALNVPVDDTVGSLATAAVVAADLLNEMNTSSLTIAQGLRDGMGASAAAIAAVGSINVIP